MPVPHDFPLAAHDNLSALLSAREEAQRALTGQPTSLFSDYAMSHNAIRWRFNAVTDADEAYRTAYQMPDVDADTEKRYLQERALFEFVAALVSTVEVLCYCSFAVGSMANPTVFTLLTELDRRRVDPKPTKDKFASAYPNDVITGAIDAMLSTYVDANTMRNVLSHRGSPPRRVQLYIGSSERSRTEWGPYEIDANTTASLRPWLAQHAATVLEALYQFAMSHL